MQETVLKRQKKTKKEHLGYVLTMLLRCVRFLNLQLMKMKQNTK
jgi:hypothetical protein